MENTTPAEFRRAFAVRFCQALEELGYSTNQQKELGKLFGVSGQAVRKWSEGQAIPNTTRLSHVANVLGVRRAWLQDGENPMRPRVRAPARGKREGDVEETVVSGPEANLLHKYRTLSVNERRVILDMVELLAKQKE